jgi:hypothetical protein
MHSVIFVVSPHRRKLLDALSQAFEDDVNVSVVMDKRVRSRRGKGAEPPSRERRRYDRREHHLADLELRERGWTMIQLLA